MENNYLIHYRTPGSKNGIRKYQDKFGHLTRAGELRYLKYKGQGRPKNVLNYDEARVGWSTTKDKPGVTRRKPYSKANTIEDKLPKDYKPHDKDKRPYKDINGEKPFAMRTPYHRRFDEERTVFDKVIDNIEDTWNNLKKKVHNSSTNFIKQYFEKSYNKYITNQLIPPKGSDGFNYLSNYTNKEADEALASYLYINANKGPCSLINSFVQTSQMNISSACARFLDALNLDDEVNSFLQKLGIKNRKF